MSNLQDLRKKVEGFCILIVDDEEEVRIGTATFMNKFFSEVILASDAESALEIFKKRNDIDILLTDIKMPGESGWELIRQVTQLKPELFIAVMTGSPGASNEELSLCDAYLNKPIGIDEITDMLEKITLKYGL